MSQGSQSFFTNGPGAGKQSALSVLVGVLGRIDAATGKPFEVVLLALHDQPDGKGNAQAFITFDPAGARNVAAMLVENAEKVEAVLKRAKEIEEDTKDGIDWSKFDEVNGDKN